MHRICRWSPIRILPAGRYHTRALRWGGSIRLMPKTTHILFLRDWIDELTYRSWLL
jgi:hypothetical protein